MYLGSLQTVYSVDIYISISLMLSCIYSLSSSVDFLIPYYLERDCCRKKVPIFIQKIVSSGSKKMQDKKEKEQRSFRDAIQSFP